MVFHLAPAMVFYCFGIINSWSRLPIFGLSELERSMTPSAAVITIQTRRPNRPGQYANNAADFMASSHLAVLSTCDSIDRLIGVYGAIALDFTWSFELDKHDVTVPSISGSNCTLEWQAPYPGTYAINVHVSSSDSEHIFFRGTTTVRIHDYWVVAIGDSFASGEGNPDQSLLEADHPRWLSERCHRSRRSWPSFVFDKLQRFCRNTPTHFTYLACTGAAVDSGVLGPASDGTVSQLEVVEEIARLRGRGPDLLMMSVGGNDVGYSDILGRLFLGNSKSLFNSIEMRLFYMAHELERLGERLRDLGARQIVIPHYFDISRNERGLIDSNCTDLHLISTPNLRLADRQILRRVNRMITDKAKLFDWTVVDSVPRVFRKGGLCSKESLIRTSHDSLVLQGDTLGAFHPVESAHESIADLVWRKLDFKRLLLT
uniref:SGNH_hydro domain-containing protein n=1 Tax=Panagrellus redivivus TaxID=6233 RepID=A0A7E4WC94_PANRE